MFTCLCLVGCTEAASATAGPAVTSELWVDGNSDVPALTTTITSQIPIRPEDRRASVAALAERCKRGTLNVRGLGDGRLVRLLLERERTPEGYRCARTELLRRSALTPRGVLGAADTDLLLFTYGFSAQGANAAQLNLTIDRDTARVTVTAKGSIVQRERMHLGAWIVEPVGDDLRFRARGAGVYDGSMRILIVHMRGMRLMHTSRLPSSYRAGTLTWRLAPSGRDAPDISVLLAPRIETILLLRETSEDVLSAVHFAALYVSLLALLVLIRRRVQVEEDNATVAAARRSLSVLIALVALLVTARVLAIWLERHPPSLPAPFDNPFAAWVAVEQLVVLFAFLVLSLYALRPLATLRRRIATAIAVGAIGIGWLLEVVAFGDGRTDGTIVAVVLGVALTATGLLALSRWFVRWWPGLAWPSRLRWRAAVGVLLLTAATASMVQSVDQLRRYIPSGHAGIWFGERLALGKDMARQIEVSLQFYPLNALQQITVVLIPMVALAIIAGVFANREDTVHPRVFFLAHPKTRSLIALTFCGFVIGLGGARGGVAIPVAFLAGLLILRLVLRSDREQIERGLAPITPALTRSDVLPAHRAELLEAALDPNRSNAITIPLPSSTDPRNLALSLGPEDTWWQNGVCAVRYGIYLAALPIGYALYVTLTKSLHSSTSYVSVIDVAGAILTETAFWTTAAFTLGALLPYLPFRNGVLKGATLAVVWATAVLAGSLATTSGDRVDPSFRFFELLMFLGLLGLLLDLRTVGAKGWDGLIALYSAGQTRIALGYLAPIAGAAYVIGAQLLSGDAQHAIQEALNRAPSLLPTH